MPVNDRALKIILVDTKYRTRLEARIKEYAPQASFVLAKKDGSVSGDPSDAEIFIAWGLQGETIEPIVAAAKDLRWFHLMSAGVESLLFPVMLEREIILTNARGVFAVPISESVLAVMLLAAKRLLKNFTNNQRRHWERVPRIELTGQTAGILGLGMIGSEVARKLACIGMRVIALKRRPNVSSDFEAEMIFGPESLGDFLSQCDWVIACAALTRETQNMLGEAEFKMMKPTAWFVNVARGEIADESALLHALDEEWIAGACLDAFAQEPLPLDSPFWVHPKVIMTPHNSSVSPNTGRRSMELVLDNLNRYLRAQPLRNVVDKEAGY